jgi:competence ComEA-like helix-hairpin-helix protein
MPYLTARKPYDFSSFEKKVRLLESMITDTLQEAGTQNSFPVRRQIPPVQDRVPERPPKSSYVQDSRDQITSININSADSLTLVRLKGIGPVLAARIIKYRESLGGYADVNQLKEIYGMDTNTLKSIIPSLYIDLSAIRKMDLNTATFKELLHHPYLEYDDVKRIVNYRDKHHPIDSLNALFDIEGLPQELVRRIKPYLMIE